MNDFQLYFKLGLQHIADWQAYDHALFLAALFLAARPLWRDRAWRVNCLWLITAFTLGHSITLALSALDVIQFSSFWIELFIPITIFISAVLQLYTNEQKISSKQDLSDKRENPLLMRFLVAAFGLIHGLGFSNYLKALLMGEEGGVVFPLFAFNLGIEAGQILIVLVLLLYADVALNRLRVSPKWWNRIISAIIMLLSLYLCWKVVG